MVRLINYRLTCLLPGVVCLSRCTCGSGRGAVCGTVKRVDPEDRVLPQSCEASCRNGVLRLAVGGTCPPEGLESPPGGRGEAPPPASPPPASPFHRPQPRWLQILHLLLQDPSPLCHRLISAAVWVTHSSARHGVFPVLKCGAGLRRGHGKGAGVTQTGAPGRQALWCLRCGLKAGSWWI